MKKKLPTMTPNLAPKRNAEDIPLTLSEKTARRALAQAMISLGRSNNPAETFRKNQDVILTALVILGRGEEAKSLAANYGVILSPEEKK